jgi:hypothetical protein
MIGVPQAAASNSQTLGDDPARRSSKPGIVEQNFPGATWMTPPTRFGDFQVIGSRVWCQDSLYR